jgi:hypothetical protein
MVSDEPGSRRCGVDPVGDCLGPKRVAFHGNTNAASSAQNRAAPANPRTTTSTAAASALQSTRDRPAGLFAVHALMRSILAAAVVTLTFVCGISAAPRTPVPDEAAPLDAIDGIIDAFRTHPIVALDEEHDDERSAAFRLSLVRDPRFARVANDIVVEFGNSRYQHVIDRFLAGGQVSDDELKKVWQDTTQAHTIWDRPIYESFFRDVRRINDGLPEELRLRILLGDPPVDWTAVRTVGDLRDASAGRSVYPARIVMAEVLEKRRRALVIYGAMHLWRQNPFQGPNLIERVEKDAGIHAFVVVTHPLASLDALGVNPEMWRVPSLALTKGSGLERQVDAVLYLGPASGRRTSQLGAALCADRSYREMRAARMLLSGRIGAGDALAKECEAAQGRPDFSGRWKPVEAGPVPGPATPSPAPGGPPPPPRTVALTITQSEARLKVDRELETEGRTTISTFAYTLDGAESINQMGPLVYATKARWEGPAVVLTSTVSADANAIGRITESYQLVNGDLVVETTRTTPAGTFTSKSVHKKQ